MNRRWATMAPVALPALLVGAVLGLAPGTAGAATPTSPSTPKPSPSPRLSIVVPLPSPLPALNLLTAGQPATANPLAGLFPAETETVPQMQAALLADVNAERAAAGLGPVAPNAWAEGVAMSHSQDMATAHTIWHNYTGYIDAAKQAIHAYVDGENVGMAETLAQADTALMASPSHKANILYPRFNTIGIGVAQDSAGYVYVTEDFADIRAPGAPVASTQVAARSSRQPAAAPPSAAGLTPAVPLAVPAVAASPIVVPTPPADPPARGAGMRATAALGTRHGTPAAALLEAVTLAALLVAGAVATVFRRGR